MNFQIIKKTRVITYSGAAVNRLRLAYACTIHKSQGSEISVVVIPLFNEHYHMLSKNLLYTALTRAESLAILIGTKRLLNIPIKSDVSNQRNGVKEQIEAIVSNYNTSSANVMLTNRIDNDSKNIIVTLLLIMTTWIGGYNVIFTKVEETEEEEKVANIVEEEIDDGVNELGKNLEKGHYHNDINNAIHYNNEPNFSDNGSSNLWDELSEEELVMEDVKRRDGIQESKQEFVRESHIYMSYVFLNM